MAITADPDEIARADRVILPGVGAAGYAMRRIDELGLREPLRALLGSPAGAAAAPGSTGQRSRSAPSWMRTAGVSPRRATPGCVARSGAPPRCGDYEPDRHSLWTTWRRDP